MKKIMETEKLLKAMSNVAFAVHSELGSGLLVNFEAPRQKNGIRGLVNAGRKNLL